MLPSIRKLVNTRGTSDLNIMHNLMNLYKDKFQDIQDFYDQYIAMRKVCDELDLHFGRCKDDARAILKENGKTNPTTANFKMAMDKVDEEHQAILFRYKANRQRFGN